MGFLPWLSVMTMTKPLPSLKRLLADDGTKQEG
jgi:hypothetical protein